MNFILISIFLVLLNCQNDNKNYLKKIPNYFLDSSEFKNGIQEFYLVRKNEKIKLDTILTIKSIDETAEISTKNALVENDSLFVIRIYNEPVGSKQNIIYIPKENQLFKTEIYDLDAIGDYIDIASIRFETNEIYVKSENGDYKIKIQLIPLYSKI
jgi:hypothetical protein